MLRAAPCGVQRDVQAQGLLTPRKASCSATTNPGAASGPALLRPACVPRAGGERPAEARALAPHTEGPLPRPAPRAPSGHPAPAASSPTDSRGARPPWRRQARARPADQPHPLQAFESSVTFAEARSSHQEFCVPVCVLPATISNNVPGTDLSLGSDTSLNVIVEVRTPSPRAGFRRPPQGPAAGGPAALSPAPAWKPRAPASREAGARSSTGSCRAPLGRMAVPTGPQRGAGQAPRGLWTVPAGPWEASGRAGVDTPLRCGRSCGVNVLSWGWALVALRVGSSCSARARRPLCSGACAPRRDGAQQPPRWQHGPQAGAWPGSTGGCAASPRWWTPRRAAPEREVFPAGGSPEAARGDPPTGHRRASALPPWAQGVGAGQAGPVPSDASLSQSRSPLPTTCRRLPRPVTGQ